MSNEQRLTRKLRRAMTLQHRLQRTAGKLVASRLRIEIQRRLIKQLRHDLAQTTQSLALAVGVLGRQG